MKSPLGINGRCLRDVLSGRLYAGDVREICANVCGDGRVREVLFGMIDDADDRVGCNVLRVLGHVALGDGRLLDGRRAEMAGRVVRERHTGKLRMMMSLLDRCGGVEGDIEAEYLDFCLENICSALPGGVRALCVKQSYAMCRYYPELLDELELRLELMEDGDMPPALRSVKRNTIRKIERLRNNGQDRF